MVDQEIHQLLSTHQGTNSQPAVPAETKDAKAKRVNLEHLPNTASLEASFAAEAVLLAALGGFLLAGKKKEEVSLLQDSFVHKKVTPKTSLVKTREV